MRSQAKAPFVGPIERSGKLFGLGLAVIATLLLSLASSAGAATTYLRSGGQYEAGGDAALSAAAVDNTTGYVFVIEGPAVNVLEGGSAKRIAAFGIRAQNPSIESVAVDQSSGAVYVIYSGPVYPVVRYVSDGANPPTFTPDPTFVSPRLETEPTPNSEEEISKVGPIAVDPTNGDLLVADLGKDRVSRFSSNGTFVRNFDGTGSIAGPFRYMLDIEVDDSGRVYVVDAEPPPASLLFGATSVIERFSAEGVPDNSFNPQLDQPVSIGYDTKTGNLVALGHLTGYYFDHKSLHVTVLNGERVVDQFDYPDYTVGITPGGVTVDGASGRLYISVNKGSSTPEVPHSFLTAYDPVLFPDLTLDPPGATTATTAQVSGVVNALGIKNAVYRFEYSYDGVNWKASENQDAVGTTPVPVSAELTGLAGNTDYQVKLVTIIPAGRFSTLPRSFSTSASAPGAVTRRATDRTPTSATLNGTVNPFGLQTTYYVEYGPTTAYGSRLPVASENTAGNGREPLPVTKVVTGLAAETTYHFRLVATNSLGTSFGEDRTFTTFAASAPRRAYEQISPIDKDGTNIEAGRAVLATADGNEVFFGSKSPIGGSEYESEGAPLFSISRAFRGPVNWSSRGIDPPLLENFAATKFTTLFSSAEDGSKSLVGSTKALAPGATDGDSNYYLKDSVSGAYTTAFSVPGPFSFGIAIGLENGNNIFRAGTPSLDAFIFQSRVGEEFIPGAPWNALYEWNEEDGASVASIAPNGEPVAGEGLAISEDGSRVLFRAGGTYERIDRERTVEIPGTYAGSTTDGRQVFVTGEGLTPDSEPGVLSLYRYDVDAEAIDLLTPMGFQGEVLYLKANEVNSYEVSGNGKFAYFVSRTDLTGDGVDGRFNLYVWHDDGVQHIATMQAGEIAYNVRGQMSPGGRYLAFNTYSQLTDYDNATHVCADLNDVEGSNPDSCREVYRYDSLTDELLCASCRPDGGAPTGQAQFRPSDGRIDYGSPHFPRHMLDNGEVFFDTPDALVATDSNGVRDVYSFDGDQATLISSGRGSGESQLGDVTPDGRSVFFTTTNQLVGQDQDSLADLYMARIGGGLAAQNPPPPRGECIRDDCKATPNSGPELPFGGSEGLSGPENVRPAPQARCGKGRQLKKRTGKPRCVKPHKAKAKKKKSNAKRAHNSRRAGR